MNLGLRLLLIHMLMIGCASTPKPTAKKKAVGAAATVPKTAKGVPAKGAVKAPVKPAVKAPQPPPPPAEEPEVEAEEEEEDDQYSRMKKYYKK